VAVGIENFVHASHLACAVVNAGDGILSAQVEEARKLDLYLGPRALLNNTVVHEGNPLFVRVRGSSRPKNALRRLSVSSLGRRMYPEVGIVINRPVCLQDSTAGRFYHVTCATKDLCGVEATGRRSLGRESEDVRVLRVNRQGQRQGDSEPRALKLVTLWPG
jgi:hypothetical protein